MAREDVGADTINYEEQDLYEALREKTGGRGPDSRHRRRRHGRLRVGFAGAYDRAKTAMKLETDRANVLRQAIFACRGGGIISVAGVYGGFIDRFPIGAVVN